MTLDSIRAPSGRETNESLTLCLRGILSAAGREPDQDALTVALGVPFVTCATEEDAPLEAWMHLARDLNLAEAAALFGVRVRDLHPRSAAEGLAGAKEFRGHFIDSYAPLIREALDNGQPVLAWRGWPGDDAWRWGIITAKASGELGFSGVTPGATEPASLVAPPVQCYVVEEANPVEPDAIAVLRCGVGAARLANAEDPQTLTGTVTGPAAFDRWLKRLEAAPVERIIAEHAAFARSLAGARSAGVRFLEKHREAMGTELRAPVDAAITECQAIATACREMLKVLAEGDEEEIRLKTASHIRVGRLSEQRALAALKMLAEDLS